MAVIHLFKPGVDITCHAAADVAEGTFVAVSGEPTDGNPTVQTASAGVRPLGVAVTSRARGEKLLVTRGGVLDVAAESAISAGDEVSVGSRGGAVRATAVDFDGKRAATVVVGIALTDASGSDTVQVALTLGA